MSLVADLTWTDGDRPVVLKVRDALGASWILKRYKREDQYRAEVHAYRTWTAKLGDRVPQLHAANDDLRTLLITVLPGEQPDDWMNTKLLRQAGELLSALHEAESFEPSGDLIAEKLALLEADTPVAEGLLGPHVVRYARSQLEALDGIAPVRTVPCHLDYSPRNWLVHEGRLSVIDFGDAAPDAWFNDFGRLFIGWHLVGEGREAFLDGYGSAPTSEELAILRACYRARLVSHVVFADEHGYVQAGRACRELLDELTGGSSG